VKPVPKANRACRVHRVNRVQLELKVSKAKLAHREQTAFKVLPVHREMLAHRVRLVPLVYREPKVTLA
jgi:hypothetical protein